MSIKAFAYVRYSDPSQSTGNSVARQTEMAVAYAAKNGVELDWSYRDDGVSAFHGHNRTVGDLGRFMADVQSGKVEAGSHLLIEGFDRFSREDPFESLYTFLTILRAGIVLVTLSDGQDWSTATLMGASYRLFGVLPHMERAHSESKAKSERTLHNWKKRRESGVVVDRLTKPAWLDVVDGEYKVIEQRGHILIRIFEEIASGIGADSVARRLNADGIAAWGRAYKESGVRAGRTKIWHGSYIQTLLNGRQVIGEHQHHQYRGRKRVPIGDPISGYYPVAVPLDLYYRAVSAFRSRSMDGGRKSTKLVNLFGDLARCRHCGGRMRWNGTQSRARDGKSFVYLICSSNRQRTGCDHAARHRLEYIEDAVFDLVTEIRLDGTADDTEAATSLAEAKHQQTVAQDRVGRIADLLIELDTPTMRIKFADAEKSLVETKRAVAAAEEGLALVRRRATPSRHQEAVAALRAQMAQSDDVSLRIKMAGVVRSVVDSISFDRDGGVMVTLMGGRRVYQFRLAKIVTEFSLVVADHGSTITIDGGRIATNEEASDFKARLLA